MFRSKALNRSLLLGINSHPRRFKATRLFSPLFRCTYETFLQEVNRRWKPFLVVVNGMAVSWPMFAYGCLGPAQVQMPLSKAADTCLPTLLASQSIQTALGLGNVATTVHATNESTRGAKIAYTLAGKGVSRAPQR
jgi:hypothetical protein